MTANVAAGTIERRFHTRHRAKTMVYIHRKVGGKKMCRAINLSATGVAIQTDNMSLRLNEEVNLIFVINLGAIQKLHRRVGRVAYVRHGQTGFDMKPYGAK